MQTDMRLSHVAMLTGIKRQTLTARANTMFDKESIMRTSGNHIIFNHEQTKALIADKLCFSPGKIIYVGMRKGGVGKSTFSYLLSLILCSLGLKVCGIDLDPQMNFSKQFALSGVKRSVFADLIDDDESPAKKIEDVIISISPNFDFIASSPKNGNIQQILALQSSKHLENWINKLCMDHLREKYDVIIIDSPAFPNTLLSAIYLCLGENDNMFLPIDPDDFCLDGIRYIRKDIQKIRDEYKKNNDIKISLIVNKMHQNDSTHLKAWSEIQEAHSDILSGKTISHKAIINRLRTEKIPLKNLRDPKEFYEIMNFLLKELRIINNED